MSLVRVVALYSVATVAVVIGAVRSRCFARRRCARRRCARVVALGLLQMQDGTRQLRLVSLIRPTSHTASCISHCTRDGRPSNRRMSDRFLGVQAVIPVADRGKDRRLDRGPVVHYLAVAEVQHPVAECSEPRVPDPIPFECRRV